MNFEVENRQAHYHIMTDEVQFNASKTTDPNANYSVSGIQSNRPNLHQNIQKQSHILILRPKTDQSFRNGLILCIHAFNKIESEQR